MQHEEKTRDEHIRQLCHIRDELERDRARDTDRTDPGMRGRLTSTLYRDWFNEAVSGLSGELGEEWARAFYITDHAVVTVPKSWPKREQRPPGVDRDMLLSATKDLLRKLGEE